MLMRHFIVYQVFLHMEETGLELRPRPFKHDSRFARKERLVTLLRETLRETLAKRDNVNSYP